MFLFRRLLPLTLVVAPFVQAQQSSPAPSAQPAPQAQQSPLAPYLDPKLPAAERAHDLVGRMTLDEKASQLEDWATPIPRLGIPDYQTWK